MADTYKPTEGMASAARRALKWKEEGKAGGTAVGLARANQLKDREPLSESTVLRMYSFFSRHAVDKQATGFHSGEEGYPSPGRVAWDLWGGDSGETWSAAKRDQIMRAREGKALTKAELNMNELQQAVTAAFNATFVFYFKAHSFHWNVEGRDFQEYHDLFGDIYEEVYEAVDSFAERIRTTQAYAPYCLEDLVGGSRVLEETALLTTNVDMVNKLLADNEQLITILREAYNVCDLAGEFGFSNFLAERIDAHRKHGWKLRASQKL